MKKNIVQCDLSGYHKEHGKWWRWNEYCDKCGVLVLGDDFLRGYESNTKEQDYCRDCMAEFLFDSENNA